MAERRADLILLGRELARQVLELERGALLVDLGQHMAQVARHLLRVEDEAGVGARVAMLLAAPVALAEVARLGDTRALARLLCPLLARRGRTVRSPPPTLPCGIGQFGSRV